MFIWDFAAEAVLGQIIDWLYSQVVGFLGEFFAMMKTLQKSNLRAMYCYEKCGFQNHGEGRKSTQDGAIIDYYQMEMKVGD